MIRAGLCIAAVIVFAAPCRAHQAVGGWSYDRECCNGSDCRPTRDDAVVRVPGGWRIVATGQVFLDNSVKHSPDGHFHRCSAYGREETHTYCLYVPEFSM